MYLSYPFSKYKPTNRGEVRVNKIKEMLNPAPAKVHTAPFKSSVLSNSLEDSRLFSETTVRQNAVPMSERQDPPNESSFPRFLIIQNGKKVSKKTGSKVSKSQKPKPKGTSQKPVVYASSALQSLFGYGDEDSDMDMDEASQDSENSLDGARSTFKASPVSHLPVSHLPVSHLPVSHSLVASNPLGAITDGLSPDSFIGLSDITGKKSQLGKRRTSQEPQLQQQHRVKRSNVIRARPIVVRGTLF